MVEIAAFAASDAGKKAISSVLGALGGLVGGLFKGHSDWYYMRQHMYGWNINSSGDKSVEFGSDVWGMYRQDLKANIALALQGQENDMDSANDLPWYHVAKAALPYKSQYFDIPGDDQLIQIACDLLNAGLLPDKNMTVQPPDFGGKYNTSWVKYQVDTVAANNQLRQTDYWKNTYAKASVANTVSNTVSTIGNSLGSAMVEPVTDDKGNVVTDSNGVVQYKTKSSVWVVLVIVAACIVCLGFVVRLFRKKKRK